MSCCNRSWRGKERVFIVSCRVLQLGNAQLCQEEIFLEKEVAEYEDIVEMLGSEKQLMFTENQPCSYPISQQLHFKNTKQDCLGDQIGPKGKVELRS